MFDNSFSKKNTAKIFENAMKDFSDCLFLSVITDYDLEFSSSDVGTIIEGGKFIRLLYANHNGYGYEDGIILNGISEDVVNKTRETIESAGFNDKGNFVFEISQETNLTLVNILFDFLEKLYEVDFCNGFTGICIYNVKYNKESQIIQIEYDTESG